jgi:hypothetical protein
MSKAPATVWQNLIERKAASPLLEDRNSFFLGIEPNSQLPVCIPRSVFDEGHYHVEGKTSAGKSSATFLSLIWQLLRGYEARSDSDTGLKAWSEPHPIIVLDLKGDKALFHATRELAKRYGQNFRFLSTRRGDDYHFFDPFQLLRNRFSPLAIATQFVRAFSLDYGLMYGGHYYTSENLGMLLEAVKLLIEDIDDLQVPASISRLSSHLKNLSQISRNEDARHILRCLQFLAEYPQIDIEAHTTPPEKQIDMARVLEDCEVVYFYLELLDETPPLRQIAGLALYSILEAAKARDRAGHVQRETFVFVDEFYHIAGPSFGDFIAAIRGWQIRLVLANQQRTQLELHQTGLSDIVQINSSVKQTYSIDDRDNALDWQFASGSKLGPNISHDKNDPDRSKISWTDQFWLNANDMHEVNDTKLRSLITFNDGQPHADGTRTIKVQGLYPISRAAYQSYRHTLFPSSSTPEPPKPTRPSATTLQLADSISAQRPHTSPAKPKIYADPDAPMREERMRQKLQELKDQEKWK